MGSTEDRSPSNAWAFNQSLGDDSSEESKETDTISALAFSPNGNYLAVGDKSGRIWIHQERKDKKLGSRRCYEHYTYFQSHSHDIDYLKSQDVEEKINMIRWCPPIHTSQLLLSTNDKTIKLWKVYNHFVHTLSGLNCDDISDESTRIQVPQIAKTETIPACSLKCVFRDGHSYHINSISLCSDGETYISSDDLRINMWHLASPNISFNILDMKPVHMEDLTEVITAAQFHPIHCNILMFSSSRGVLRLMDLRHRAILTTPDCTLEQEPDPNDRSFFSEIISSISDCQYTCDGRFIICRDYLTARIWDPRHTRRAYDVVPIHENVRSRLADAYENDSIFDKFEICSSSPAASPTQLLTGSYDNEVLIYDWDKKSLDRLRPLRTSYGYLSPQCLFFRGLKLLQTQAEMNYPLFPFMPMKKIPVAEKVNFCKNWITAINACTSHGIQVTTLLRYRVIPISISIKGHNRDKIVSTSSAYINSILSA